MDDINLICIAVIAAVLVAHFFWCNRSPRFGQADAKISQD
jgi:hypothetical protein